MDPLSYPFPYTVFTTYMSDDFIVIPRYIGESARLSSYLWFITYKHVQIIHRILKIMSGETRVNENQCHDSDADPQAAITFDEA